MRDLGRAVAHDLGQVKGGELHEGYEAAKSEYIARGVLPRQAADRGGLSPGIRHKRTAVVDSEFLGSMRRASPQLAVACRARWREAVTAASY